MVLIFRGKQIPLSHYVGSRKSSPSKYLLAFVMAFGYVQVVYYYFLLIPSSWTTSYDEASSSLQFSSMEPLWLIFTLMVDVLLVPIAEELVFRGVVFGLLRERFSFVFSALLSSLLFGISHGHPVWMVYTFVFGLIACTVREKFTNIRLTMLMHATLNFFGTLNPYLPLETGVQLIIMGAGIAIFALTAIGMKRVHA